jgi:hypothetical protein
MGVAVHKPQIRTSATRRTSPAAACRSPPPDHQFAEDPGLSDHTGATRPAASCSLARARDGQRRLRVPVAPMVLASSGHAAAAVQAWQSARRAVLRGVPRGAASGPSPRSARFGGDLSTSMTPRNRAIWQPDVGSEASKKPSIRPRYVVAYRRWLEVGDPPLTSLTRSRLRSLLTPLVSGRSTSQGVEEEATRGDRGLTRPQPQRSPVPHT